jgi:hypothetical protein
MNDEKFSPKEERHNLTYRTNVLYWKILPHEF